MLAKKISSHFDIGRVYMLHRGARALSSNHDYTHRLSRFSVVYKQSSVVLASNFFLGLHVPRVKKTPISDFPKKVCYFLRFN